MVRRFTRIRPGTYAAIRDDGLTLAYIERFQTKWIAWDARTHHAIRGPFGLGGSPFNTLADAKSMIREQYG